MKEDKEFIKVYISKYDRKETSKFLEYTLCCPVSCQYGDDSKGRIERIQNGGRGMRNTLQL